MSRRHLRNRRLSQGGREAQGRRRQLAIIEPEEFIEGEMKPHQSPGVGFGDGHEGRHDRQRQDLGRHQIKVPVDEAKYVVAKKIAERADDIAA
jgi:hypothetical protein